MRRGVRFVVGAGLGIGALAVYLWYVGPEAVGSRVAAVAPWAVGVVCALMLAEATVDGLGVWASVRPLRDGLSPRASVQFAFAGDFFDVLSPAGPVSSEPIMAQFFGVATETSYSEALGVRGVAKYVKSAAQLLLSVAIVGVLFLDAPTPRFVLVTLAGAVVALFVVGAALIWARDALSAVVVAVLAPVVRVVSGLTRETPVGREAVADAVGRFWERVVHFRDAPELLGLIALSGVFEQLITSLALWVALAGTGTTVAFLPIVAVIPLPQAASVVPIPGSLGAYDVLLAGALSLTTGAPAAGAAAAVLVVRTFELLVSLGCGGVATGFLRGFRT
ncbi:MULTISPECIES: lysylphosphatidylglycerol synthase transmembrane domain-containing protein [unclassified Haloferax]|uniref:lysylphosphatidylglycerol synthase transmembrane domain-containing protein n=1 Tax=unclassified Haloferax TaxID=2625095 RepID=UPI000737D6D4|nr:MULTISPECIES: lysylphosphatidylglycerol synthase domain-containing protein [unclassified Haloferax]MCO8267758.1 flippase-like domain-containing protein [Haloferax sp. AB510]